MFINDEGIENLFREHRSKMQRLATLLLKDEVAAQDVVSEVFLKVIDSRPQMNNVESFLLTAVRNHCISILRNKSAADARPLSDLEKHVSATGSEKTDLEERLQRIEEFISKRLTEQTRRVLYLRFKEKRRYAEIAAELSISEAAVYKHLSQGLKKLRQEFNPD